MKTFKTNRWIIIATDYHTWPAKLFWVCNHFDRQAINLFDTPQQAWLQHFENIELKNSLSCNINNNGNNKEETKNLKNQGGNIPGGNFLGGNFPGGFIGGSLIDENFSRGNFPGGTFPDTQINIVCEYKLQRKPIMK